MDEDEYHAASGAITERLKNTPEYKDADIVHCYVSMNKRREADTHSLIKAMLAGKKKVVVPKVNPDSGTLSHFELNSFDELSRNSWGVLEPRNGEEVPPDVLELVVVPMVGGDEQGNRIGYGKGFYDRFLTGIKCPLIGLCFEECIADRVPVEDFDVPLDKIVTERRVIG